MTPGWEVAAAEAFWDAAGEPPPFPRDLSAALPLAFPAALVVLPGLALDRIAAWLARRGAADLLPDLGPRGRLRGCVVAYGGFGFVFVDGADAPDERRFTLAHEAAHLFLDYLRPRERALTRLGPGIAPVLDGTRQPTPAERVDAALVNCPIGVHVHLLARNAAHTAAEDRADRLARELLAPRALVAAPGQHDPDDVARALRERFGLPPAQADAYARDLDRTRRPAPSYVEWLRP